MGQVRTRRRAARRCRRIRHRRWAQRRVLQRLARLMRDELELPKRALRHRVRQAVRAERALVDVRARRREEVHARGPVDPHAATLEPSAPVHEADEAQEGGGGDAADDAACDCAGVGGFLGRCGRIVRAAGCGRARTATTVSRR